MRDTIRPLQALDAIVQVQQATSPPQLMDLLADATAAIGATASLYSVAIPEPEGEPFSLTLVTGHPAVTHCLHDTEALHEHPWFQIARSHGTPGTGHAPPMQADADRHAAALAEAFGFASCLVVPTAGGANLSRTEMLCLGSPSPMAFEGDDARLVRALARSLAGELHDWVTRHLSERLRRDAQLRPSDIELLRLEWQGLGTKAICAHTAMTPAAVDSRFQRIIARLECASRKDAARKAAEHGVLEHPAELRATSPPSTP